MIPNLSNHLVQVPGSYVLEDLPATSQRAVAASLDLLDDRVGHVQEPVRVVDRRRYAQMRIGGDERVRDHVLDRLRHFVLVD